MRGQLPAVCGDTNCYHSVNVRHGPLPLRQMVQIIPQKLIEFVKGNFVTQKSSHKFSALAHDQIHEQQNALVKGDGGIVGITENEGALRRWLVPK